MTVTIETIELENFDIIKKFTTDLTNASDLTNWEVPAIANGNIDVLIVGAGGPSTRSPGWETYGSAAGGGGVVFIPNLPLIIGSNIEIEIGGFTTSGAQGYRSRFDTIIVTGGNGNLTSPGGLGGTNNKTTGQGGRDIGGSAPGIKGGDGVKCNITGVDVWYGGGGGSAGATNGGGFLGGAGGLGGGGRGSDGVYPWRPSTNGVNTLGGGGGGSGVRSGGSGVVIIKYRIPEALLKSIHTIVTGSGSLLIQNKLHQIQGDVESPNMLIMRY